MLKDELINTYHGSLSATFKVITALRDALSPKLDFRALSLKIRGILI
jgi:hypothetical protein